MKLLRTRFSAPQIRALLKKDVLVRLRQPWMTVVQFVWPCLIFILLYTIRDRFGPQKIDNCQFPTRQLPTKSNVLPFFHSYICSIENRCSSTEEYEEYSKLENAPMKPIIDIAQIFIKDDALYNALVDLPKKANFISTVTSLVTNKYFNDIRDNIGKVVASIPRVEEMLGQGFDIKQLFSDRSTFVMAGNLLCGHPFPSTDVIPIANDILYSEDFSEVNDDELNAMPTNYCKKLYLDVTSSNFGKLTWSQIKPIIHGKILYSPVNEETESIIKYSNTTFEEISRLVNLALALDESLVKLRNDTEFQGKFDSLLELAKSPIVKSLVGDSVDIGEIEAIMNGIRYDQTVFEVVHTIKNILECFSVDRFMGVATENELQHLAFNMNKQRLFYAGIHFNKTDDKNIVYNFHMDTDNTPPTAEVKSRFWFPGPEGRMAQDLKYHQGFVQIKHSIDMGIIKHKKHELIGKGLVPGKPSTTTESLVKFYHVDDEEEEDSDDDWFTNDDSAQSGSNSTLLGSSGGGFSSLISGFFDGWNGVNKENISASVEFDNDEWRDEQVTTIEPSTVTDSQDEVSTMLEDSQDEEFTTVADSQDEELTTFADSEDDEEFATTTMQPEEQLRRKKRSPQGGLFDLFLGMAGVQAGAGDKFEVENLQFFTKQFPYPAYTNDNFKTGLYLGQAIQFAFFIGLMAQIATCVRHRIWMRESRNTMIMRSMGLKSSSELISWCIITAVEMILIIIGVCIILYSGGIMNFTKVWFVMFFLAIFGLCLISFCYMCATFFTSATVGSVTTSLLFLISFTPYILFIIFDAKLTTFENFFLNLSFTSAFAQAWNHILRMELQMTGLGFSSAFEDGLSSDFAFALVTIVFDTFLYAVIGFCVECWTNDEYQFTDVTRDELGPNMGATMTNVSKIYGDNNIAVSNISVGFQRDQVTCLLGRNGAGKSTIIKMLTGQVVQTTGRVILSQSSDSQADEYDKIGVCSQDNILIPNLTAKEHLELYAKIKLRKGYHSVVSKTLKSMKFGKHENFPAWKLSGGYQRRLCVAIAFIASPNVVILDEPCNGVDNKARKDIWDLIEALRKGRAVVFATHFLDEAEYLSDNILIMKNGKIIAKHNPETMKALFTQNFDLEIHCCDLQAVDEVKKLLDTHLNDFKIAQDTPIDLKLEISYDQQSNNCPHLMDALANLQKEGRISEHSVQSKNLEEVFTEVNSMSEKTNGYSKRQTLQPVDLKTPNLQELIRHDRLSTMEKVKLLFGKRFTHFSRNYRMLLCALILPAVFEIIAMWFVNLRLEDDFDRPLKLSKALYPETTDVLSMENPTDFTQDIYGRIRSECKNFDTHCKVFEDSTKAFYWILDTSNLFHEKRYGGTTFNETRATIWYNNKGHHSMISWLNDLNSNVLQAEMNDTGYSIESYNVPWKLGDREFSISSILRQVSDAGVSFIILISLSLVMAVASVYIVNERMKGEKLQQRLCGVNAATYWGVAFVWDYLVLIVGILICAGVLLGFGMPVYTTKSNLWGICLLSFLYGFACIPAIHVVEKLFTDSSMAIMTIFCMNAIIPIFTMSVVIIIGIVGESETADNWRFFLNRAFLIFPQHALGDGLVEICKNFVVAEFFHRYDINSYKNPINSNLLLPHMCALITLGVIFLTLNILIESGVANKLLRKLLEDRIEDPVDDLKIISIQNSLKRTEKIGSMDRNVLRVERLTKRFGGKQYAVKDVSFEVASGECFGLLGKNGAGKSTIFKMLSGQMQPSGGSIVYANKEIAYCPQTNTLDDLLTVKEMIEFYGKLRRINDIQKLTESTLMSFQLESYKDVLVKNLSGGNRRKLNVAITCFGWTGVVLMDEPTSDMDPVTRSIVYHAIDDLIAEQRAIVLTSHSISEIDHICHRIAVMKEGQILTCSRPETLKMQYGGYYSVAVFCEPGHVSDIEKKIKEAFPSCTDVQPYTHSIKFVLAIQQTHPENGISSLDHDNKTSPTLAELFRRMNFLTAENSEIRFTINRCRLDTVFEKILDSSDCIGGHVHNGYIETETTT